MVNRAHAPTQTLMGELFERSPKRRAFAVLAWVLAVAGQSLAATLVVGGREQSQTDRDPANLELRQPDPPRPEELPRADAAREPSASARGMPAKSVSVACTETPLSVPSTAGARLTAEEATEDAKRAMRSWTLRLIRTVACSAAASWP